MNCVLNYSLAVGPVLQTTIYNTPDHNLKLFILQLIRFSDQPHRPYQP